MKKWIVSVLLTNSVIGYGQADTYMAGCRRLDAVHGHLQFSVRHFDGTDMVAERSFSGTGLSDGDAQWVLRTRERAVKGEPDAVDVTAVIVLAKGAVPSSNLNVSFAFSGWSRANYVLAPASVYNGNRYRAIGNGYAPAYPIDMYYNAGAPTTISNNPRLAVDPGRASTVELQTGNVATPAMCFYAPALSRGFIVLTDQAGSYGNHGLTMLENASQDSFRLMISEPAVRKMAPGFGDFGPSGDKAPDWKAGDSVTLHFRIYVFHADGIPALLKKFFRIRKDLSGGNSWRLQTPMSQIWQWGAQICSSNFIETAAGKYYRPENGDNFQLGWVSGMINTYCMLGLDDRKERMRVSSELDFIVQKLQGASGYFYGGVSSAGVLLEEKMNAAFPAAQAMVRKNGDVLFWLMKHLMLYRVQGHGAEIGQSWMRSGRRLAEAFVKTWRTHGEFGQYIVPDNGEMAVYGSTAGAVVPAGLVLASEVYHEPAWLDVAKAAANHYYDRWVLRQGLTGGACGDISQDPDSETAFGFLETLMALYYATGDVSWLRKAQVQAALCSTWVLSYDAVFPPQSTIGRLQGHMAGAVFASIQNKHAAPGVCTSSADGLFKLFRATGDTLCARLIADIQHAHHEVVNRPGHLTTHDATGSSMERIQPSDAEGRGSVGEVLRTRNSWTETDGMLMAMELPGIYIRTDSKKITVFDDVRVRITGRTEGGMWISISNPTAYDATVSVFAENAAAAAKPLSYVAWTGWRRVRVKAGGSLRVRVPQLF